MKQDEMEVKRLLDLLRTLLRLLDCSFSEIERRLSLRPSTLTSFFRGRVEARLGMVLSIARAAGFRYDEFFAMAYPPGLGGEMTETARHAQVALAALQSARRDRRRSGAGRIEAGGATEGPGRRERRQKPRTPRKSPGSMKAARR